MKNSLTHIRILITGILLIGITSCDQRFNSEQWKIEDPSKQFPFRNSMIEDIIDNNRLMGLSYNQLLDSLGQPYFTDENRAYYLVEENYDSRMAPVYIKSLMVTVSDSLVTDVKIDEQEPIYCR